MNKRKIFNDPVYGFIEIPSELIFDLIEHPWFQRLRRIKQLGLTHYVYPGAHHTRFQHAIGAMHLMRQAIDSLRLKDVEISNTEAEAALISVLLHDIGHGPYSHALEGSIIDLHHETLTQYFMHHLNDEFNGALQLAIQIFNGTYDRPFLHQLVSGQLDVDRMDYLQRDSFFTGVAEGIIGYDRMIKMLNVSDNKLVVEEKAIFSIEKFIAARRLMYWQVYLHKAVISAEQMLKQALILMRVEGVDQSLPCFPTVLQQFLSQEIYLSTRADDPASVLRMLTLFAQLDDVDIVYALKLLSKITGKAAFFSKRILQRRLFKVELFDEPVGREYIEGRHSDVASLLGISIEESKGYVITGAETVPTYDSDKNEISMLMKSGEVKELSQILKYPQNFGRKNAYFLCYPKNKL